MLIGLLYRLLASALRLPITIHHPHFEGDILRLCEPRRDDVIRMRIVTENYPGKRLGSQLTSSHAPCTCELVDFATRPFHSKLMVARAEIAPGVGACAILEVLIGIFGVLMEKITITYVSGCLHC